MADPFIKIPFALSGDKTAIPDDIQVNGSVSYTEGWGIDYAKNASTQVLCDLTGTPGTLIPAGSSVVMSDSGFSFQLLAPVTLDVFGQAFSVLFQSMITGFVAAPAGTIQTIVFGVIGWDQATAGTVTNPTDAFIDITAKKVPRNQSNQILFDISSVANQYQTHGVPDFITTLDNDGIPYAYNLWSIVRYDDGGGFDIYQSIVDANDSLPTDTTKWKKLTGTIAIDNPNFVRNPQFTLWGNNDYLDPDSSQDVYTNFVLTGGDRDPKENKIADDWIFVYNFVTPGQNEISRQKFQIGQIEVPANPVSFLRFKCTVAGVGGLFKSIVQDWSGVESFSGETVSVGFYARSPTSSQIIVDLEQRNGTGGSPTLGNSVQVINASLTPNWQLFQGTVTIPDIPIGTVLGTDQNDVFRIEIRLPLDTISEIDFCNIQMHLSDALPPFPYHPVNNQIRRTDANTFYSTNPTGTVILGVFDTSQNYDGYVHCDDGTIGTAASLATAAAGMRTFNLYKVIWNAVSNLWAPVTGGRGASAIDDFNANKPMQITKILGRALASSGAGSGLTPRVIGQTLGEESVGLLAENNGLHGHGYQHVSPNFPGVVYWESSGGGDKFLANFTTATSGSGTPHNNMQPSLFLPAMIKL